MLRARVIACPSETPFALRWHDHAHRIVQGEHVAHVRLDCGNSPIRLDLLAGSIDAAALVIRPELRLDESFAATLVAVRRLFDLLGGRSLEPAKDKRMAALALALRALDAQREGHGLHEIAHYILGLHDWPGTGDWVKSRARRLVKLAARLEQVGPYGVLRRQI